MFSDLVNALNQAEKSFDPDELAFLALTSKIEQPFRDRLAYALAGPAVESGGRIAREYKRGDIAWLIGQAPKAIVELKACYTRDLITQPEIYLRYLKSDLQKAAACGGPDCGCFAVLLATHPRSSVPPEIFDTIKYARKVNSEIKKYGNPEEVRQLAEVKARSHLHQLGPTHEFCWSLGAYLGIQVDLLGWLVEARALGAN